MKRILAVFLAITLLVCCCPTITFAAQLPESVKRYTVLVLDTSSTTRFTSNGEEIYTADTAIEYVKKASSRFLDNIRNASGDNYVAVVSYKDTASIVSDFTKDFDYLKDEIEDLYASSNTRSIADGLEYANDLLEDIDGENVIKNVVLFTTGMTNAGGYNYSGKYDSTVTGSNWYRVNTNVKLYAYANVALAKADIIKANDIGLYTIGLFQVMDKMPEAGQDVVALFKLTAKDLATSEEYFYPVDDPDNLEFTFGEVADNIINPLQEITFTYQSGKDYTATCYYTNDYFSESASVFKPSLATMSLSFAMSAFGSSNGGGKDYSNKSVNAKKLLMDIGVPEENIQINDWFTKKPTTDSIGVIAGNMPITVKGENYTLIAVAVRGGGYEQEWASNFTIGQYGQHKGFETAKNNVISFLRSYVDDQNISGAVKLWITGYSRAAATANLVGGALDNGTVISTDISYSYDDIYTYCFETPAGALKSEVKDQEKYNNIFNILNSSDPVPKVAPSALGFCRYGEDKVLPSRESDPDTYATLRSKMLKIYNELDSTEEYIVDDFQMKKITGANNWLPGGDKISLKIEDDTKNDYSQELFLDNYVNILSKEFLKNRSNYVAAYQDEIREICSVIFGCTDEQSEKLIDSLVSQGKDEWKDLLWSYIWNVGVNPWGSEEDALQIVSDWLKKAVKDAGITNYNESTIDSAGKNLADLLLALVSNHPNYATTAFMNIKNFGAAHYPELCYSWLASMDDNYTEGAKVEFNNGGYRIIRINCAVDVEVYDEQGNKVASIKNEQPESLSESSYIFGVDEDGQKFVVLPNDAEYDISIVGRETDQVNYSISEYDASCGDYTRNVNYFDILLEQGESLNGVLPAYNEDELEDGIPYGSEAEYVLFDSNDELIMKTSDKSGDDAQLVFNVNVTTSDSKAGVVTGSGLHQYGTFAQVEAIAFEGYQFIGWYCDGSLVSTDMVYRVCVTEDIELEGRFEKTICSHDSTEIRGATDASCTEGYTGDTYCNICGEIIVVGEIIPAQHNLYKIDAVSATHETSGNIEYYACDNCGKLFKDAAATTEILLEDTIIDKIESITYLGDVDGNGRITASDARIILRASAKLDILDVSKFLVADVNSDLRITASDARTVLRMSARLESLIEMPSGGTNTPTPPPSSSLTAIEVHDIASKYTVEVNAKNDEYHSTGSGFFTTADGRVVTNYHVIDGMYEITVTDYKGVTYNVVQVLAFDADMDIAVLKVNAKSTPAVLNTETPCTGAVAYTLGSSKGLTDTFSNGIISNGSRVVPEYHPYIAYIQTTAPISNGNSGGPLINDKAEVIGINSWMKTDGQNLNFAIPVMYLDDLNYNNPLTMDEFANMFRPTTPDKPAEPLRLDVDTSLRYLDKGGTAIIDVEVIGDLEGRDLIVDYDSGTFRCEWEENWYTATNTGNDVAVLYVSPLKYTSTKYITVYVDGMKDTTAVNVPISATSDGWYDYGGYIGAVDYGAYTRVAPYLYYMSDDADALGFYYSFSDLVSAGYSEEVIFSNFFDYLESYGYEYYEKNEYGSRTSYSFYNSEYNIVYSYSLIYDNYGDITDIMIVFVL